MGLTERRRIADIKDQTTPAQAEIKAITGYDLSLNFDTTTFPEDSVVLDGYDYYKDYAVPMILRIFKDITKDALGKTAAQEKIKSIKIINTSKKGDDPGTKELSLTNGELLISYGFYQYSDNVWGEDELKSKIENLL